MSDALLWLAIVLALPLLVVAASYIDRDVERLRRLAVGAALTQLAVAIGIALAPPVRAFAIQSTALTWTPGGEAILRVGSLSAVLVPFAAGLWLLTVAVTPRSSLDRNGLQRTALATVATLASFLTESAVVLLALSVASVWVFLAALADPAHRVQRRVAARYLGTSTILFAAGVVMLIAPGAHGTIVETAGVWFIVIAALIRKGIIPFHAWVPEVFDRGRLGPAILFTAPQLGSYMTVVLIVPRASPELLRTIAMLALATAVYGAALALAQRSARRACGYLFVSQSALVMAGLDCTSATALAGGLLVWLSAGLAFAGLARCVLVLEARRGRLDLTTYHGGYERMPLLASSFLAMGLACTGFPGTLGFVGQELLVTGAIDQFPVMGFALVLASALTGLAVVRMYFSLFCGRPAPLTHAAAALALKQREAWTFGAVVVTLITLGVAPRQLVNSRFAAAEDLLRLRRTYPAVSQPTFDAGSRRQSRARSFAHLSRSVGHAARS
jgi:NADH-quinone oxidoreductase subunit M